MSVTTTKLITEAEIVDDPPILPGYPSGSKTVHANFGDGNPPIILFSYFIDELSFTADEFIGLTREEARQLHFHKDTEYLRS